MVPLECILKIVFQLLMSKRTSRNFIQSMTWYYYDLIFFSIFLIPNEKNKPI